MSEQWLERLSGWLSGKGFVRSDIRESGGFGNVVVEFKSERAEVHVTRDRGEWYIGLAPPVGSPSMGPYVWRYYLDDMDPSHFQDPETLEEQLDFVYGRLGEVISAIECDEEIGGRLRAVNRIIVSKRLGLNPGTLRRENSDDGERNG
ncbi:hypothetical protein [Streptomyces sp. NPDC003710]